MAPSLKIPSPANLLQSIINVLRLISVEPYLFFCLFGYSVRMVSFQSLLMESACTNLHAYPDEICRDLDNHTMHQASSIKAGNNLYSAIILLTSLPAIIVAIFLGPWSDKYSRKYPLVISASGMMLEATATAALTFFPSSSPYWYVGVSFLAGISGGFIVAASSAFSYMADVTDERSRPTRYAMLEFSTLFAVILSSVVSGQIFKIWGHRPVMMIAPCSFALSLLYTIFLLKDTKKRPTDLKTSDMVRDLFTIDNLKESFRTCIKKRPGNIRLQIWLLVCASCSHKFVYMGTLAISFPYARRMYKWDVADYSQASTIFSAVSAVITLSVVPLLSKKLRLHEAALGLIGMLSLTSKMAISASSVYEGLFYFAWVSGALNNTAGIAIRSRISKLVSKGELGRIFTLVSMCESVTPLLGTLAFTQVYNASVRTFPGLAFAASTVILIPSIFIFWWMNKLPSISVGEYAKDEKPDTELKETVSSNEVTLKDDKL